MSSRGVGPPVTPHPDELAPGVGARVRPDGFRLDGPSLADEGAAPRRAPMFDFLTWFEFAPADAAAFDDLTHLLRRTEEWKFVEREVDIRLELAPFTDEG